MWASSAIVREVPRFLGLLGVQKGLDKQTCGITTVESITENDKIVHFCCPHTGKAAANSKPNKQN